MATKKTTTAKTAAKKTTAKKTTTAKAAPKKAVAKKTTAKKTTAKKTTAKKTTKKATDAKKANNALDKLNKMEVTLTIEELNRMVEHRAYDLYMERGYSHGDDMHDWLEAEKEIRSKFVVK